MRVFLLHSWEITPWSVTRRFRDSGKDNYYNPFFVFRTVRAGNNSLIPIFGLDFNECSVQFSVFFPKRVEKFKEVFRDYFRVDGIGRFNSEGVMYDFHKVGMLKFNIFHISII